MPSASGHVVPPDAGSIRLKRLRLGVVVFGVLVILAFAASSAYDAWASYRYARAATEREIDNTANALAEQTAWILRAVDLLLLDTARWYSSDSREIPAEQLNAALAIRTAAVQQVRQVRIVDSRGNPIYWSREAPTPTLNVSDRSYFIAQRDGTAHGMFMSEPLVTRSEGRAGVTFSRRLDDENGHFAGVVTALVDLDDLNQFYRAVNVGMGSAIQLMRDDGTLLLRNPRTPEALGRAFPELIAAGAAPAAQLVNPIDGHSDFIAIAPVGNARLRIAVTRESAVALQPWRNETIRITARTLVLTLLGGLTIVALLSQLRRAAAGEQALRESEQRYALAMEGANEGHWDWDIRADRLFLSPKMKMLGGQPADSEIGSRTSWMTQIVIHPDDSPRFETALKNHVE
jgi:PAS domain-containing protein